MTPAFGLRQFVHLRRHRVSLHAEAFQPTPRRAIAVEAGMPAVDQDEHAAEPRIVDPRAEVCGRQRVELFARLTPPGFGAARPAPSLSRGAGVPEAGEIDQV